MRLALLPLLTACAEAPERSASADPAADAAPPSAPGPAPSPDGPTPAAPRSLADATHALGLPWPPPNLSLSVDKSDRELTAWSGDRALKTYRVGLGGAPEGDKLRQGDRRTPTGDLRVVTRNPQSKYHLFLGLSYPTDGHAARGLAEGQINRAQHDAIVAANAAGRQPPWDTPLGGAIGLHGRGGSEDWTLGCVALEDDELDELWAVARIGTPVRIQE